MHKLILIALSLLSTSSVSAQFVATLEITESIEGICNEKEVYALFPMLDGQEEAVCPVTKDEIFKRLNQEVAFLKENPKYKGKGMIGIIINCNGEVVQCKMDNKTGSEELDKQIEEVFSTLGNWKAGKLSGREVDSSQLFSFKIKKGEITPE